MGDLTGTVLVVDDDRDMLDFLRDILSEEELDVDAATSGEAALACLKEKEYDLLITDLKMKGMKGLELLSKIQALDPTMKVVIITAFGTIETAIEAMKLGAFDYLTKPFKTETLIMVVEKALREVILQKEISRLREELEHAYRFDNIIGKSKGMREIYEVIKRVADSSGNVLIMGESGSGKKLIAKTIHYNSPRKTFPFVELNCAAVPEELLARELFGCTKGAFPDARREKRGALVEADSGTVLLDEISALSPHLQEALFKVLETREVKPLGSSDLYRIDTRVLASSRKNLRLEVAEGRFREDLLYKINAIHIHLPPLREREGDVVLLTHHFLTKYAQLYGKEAKKVSEEALALLVNYHWPGNVRELENLIERAVTLGKGEVVTQEAFPPYLMKKEPRVGFLENAVEGELTLEELEQRYILATLDKVNGNKSKAAEILGLDRTTLYRKLEQYQKEKEKKEPPEDDVFSSLIPRNEGPDFV